MNRHRKRTASPPAVVAAEDYAKLRRQYLAVIESLPDRDKAVAQAAVNATAQGVADNTVTALREAGWLRRQPGPSTVKRVIRDDDGRVSGIVESDEEIA